jgi:hypothetical protein
MYTLFYSLFGQQFGVGQKIEKSLYILYVPAMHIKQGLHISRDPLGIVSGAERLKWTSAFGKKKCLSARRTFFIFLHVRHVREEKEEEEHDGRIKKNKGYTTTRMCWWVTKRKELKSFLKFKRPALFIF